MSAEPAKSTTDTSKRAGTEPVIREPAIRLGHLDHIVLRAADPQKVSAFYIDVLGCTHERELDIGLVQLRAGRCLVDIVAVDSELGRKGGGAPDPDGRNVDHFCFRVDPFDVAAIGTHLRAHGVDPGSPARRYGADGFGQSIYISDPEGNIVELKGPPET